VDLEHSRFTVRFGESEEAKRALKLRTEARDIFARRLPAPGRWVFPSSNNPSQHIGQAQRPPASFVKRSGVLCVPYDFQHTFASRAANE
jgi:integrase